MAIEMTFGQIFAARLLGRTVEGSTIRFDLRGGPEGPIATYAARSAVDGAAEQHRVQTMTGHDLGRQMHRAAEAAALERRHDEQLAAQLELLNGERVERGLTPLATLPGVAR